MIISLALIIAVLLGLTPWALFALCITWIPDVTIFSLWYFRGMFK